MNFLRPFAAFLIVASGASAEDVMITEPDGTVWSSYAANLECIKGTLKRELSDNAHISLGSEHILAGYQDVELNTFQEIKVDFKHIEGQQSPAVETIRYTFSKANPDPDRNNENRESASKIGFISYKPLEVKQGLVKTFDDLTSISEVTIQSGGFAENGFGSVDFPVEKEVRNIDAILRACDLGF